MTRLSVTIIAIFSVTLSCSISTPLPGAYNPHPMVYYVDQVHPSASDSNDGSETSPWKTLDIAGRTAIAGDTVYIKSGTYTSKLFPRSSGNSSQYITFRNYPGHSVTLAPTEDHGVYLSGVLYIKIQGLIIRDAPQTGILIQTHFGSGHSGPSDHNIILSNIIHHNGNGSEDGHGIFIGGYDNLILHNKVYNNGSSGSSVPTHGIYLLGNNNRILSNQSLSNAWQGIRSEGENNEVAWNTLSYNAGKGFSIWADAPLTARDFNIHHNLLVDNKETGIGVNGGGGGIPQNIYLYNNTIINTGTARHGISLFNGCINVKIKNNIIYGVYTNGTLLIQADCASGLEVDYNLFFGTEAFYYLGTSYYTISAFTNASASLHSIWADPDLDAEYNSQLSSPGRNSGVDLNYEYLGSAPDRGFSEYNE